jgi:glutamate 5-kinase
MPRLTLAAAPAPRRVVLKVGTSTLSTDGGRLDVAYVRELASQVARAMKAGNEVVLVTSGAIGSGIGALGLKERPRDQVMRQACASVGQGILMQVYRDAFAAHCVEVAQLLLTYDAFSKRRTYLNLRNNLSTLLKLRILPIVNENDAIATDEIDAKFGDNDRLASLVATKLSADLLVILTDTDGLYDRDPRKDPGATLIPAVTDFSADLLKNLAVDGGSRGTGGMRSKLAAARIASGEGCEVVLANGRAENVLSRVLSGDAVGTRFPPKYKSSKDKFRQWLAAARPRGRILVDTGAEKALKGQASLLAVGVVGVEGDFPRGSVVRINDFATGVSEYSSREIAEMCGKRTKDLGKEERRRAGVVVTRHKLVLG